MIPEDRFSSVTFSGKLLNPFSMNRLTSQCWGPIHIQDPSEGLLYQIWTAVVVNFSVYIEAANTPRTLLFTRGSEIQNISVAFDQNGRPCIAFQQSLNSYLYWFDPVPNDYVFYEIPDNAKSPCVTLDDARPLNLSNSDVILAYVRADTIMYRIERERFQTEYIPEIGSSGQTVNADILYYVGMNAHNRLEFIYALDTPIRELPTVMKTQIIEQKAPVEELDITFNFLHTMLFNEAIVSVGVTITVYSGVDAAPDLMLSGDPTFTASTATQRIIGGLPGVTYLLAMSVRTDRGCVYVNEGFVVVNDSPAISPPAS